MNEKNDQSVIAADPDRLDLEIEELDNRSVPDIVCACTCCTCGASCCTTCVAWDFS